MFDLSRCLVLGKVCSSGFDPSVKYDYFHRFFRMNLCMRIYLLRGLEFSPRTFFPEKDFTEDPKWSWMALKLMPLR